MANSTGLVMHIDNDLDFTSRRELEGSLKHQSGVSSARFNEKRPHLMLVEYDPDTISYVEILSRVKNNHVHAERIG